MRLFITGATGFVGGAIARECVRRGDTVRAMARSADGTRAVRALGAEPVECSLETVDARHISGSDAVVHAAAFVGPWGSRRDFERGNVEGTRRVLEAARAAGATHFVFIGTEAAVFHGQHMREIDERAPYALRSPFLYSETKARAEALVLAANDPAAGFATVAVRPRLVWGPGDTSVLPEVLRMIENGAFAWIDGGRSITDTTHVDNVVHAVLLALEKGRGGEAYFVTDGERRTVREFLTSYVRTRGTEPPGRSMPGGVVRALAFVVEKLWRVLRLGSAPPIVRFAAAAMSRDCTIRIDKIRNELGYEPVVSFADGMERLRAAS
jgi:hypothetical protein